MLLSSSGSLLMSAALALITLTSSAHSWSLWANPGMEEGWNLRSAYCANTNGACSKTSDCCSNQDVCQLTALNIGICKSKLEIARGVLPYKRSRIPCRSSSECPQGCCRVYRLHRFGKGLYCGTESNQFMKFQCA